MDESLYRARGVFPVVSRINLRPAAALALLLAAVLLLSGSGSAGSYSGSGGQVPENAAALTRASGDLDGDGMTEEYSLEDHAITVKEGGQILWKSPSEWRVDGFALGDADNDGKANLVFSLWKVGSFGEVRPFWHTGEDGSYKNHLFVYKLQDNSLKPVWCSSNLDRPILSFTVGDVNGDGLNELDVKEGRYVETEKERYAADPEGSARTAVWQWDEWGFRLLDSY